MTYFLKQMQPTSLFLTLLLLIPTVTLCPTSIPTCNNPKENRSCSARALINLVLSSYSL